MASLFAWFDLTKGIAVAGLMLGIVNAFFNLQNRRLAVEQERRRAPRLQLSLIHGFYRRDLSDGAREFAFLVTVRNPTDTNNSIAEADLAIMYLTKERIELTAKIRASVEDTKNFVRGQNGVLSVPIAIHAHNAVSGWLHFRVAGPMMQAMDVEGYFLVVTDTHGGEISVAVDLVPEYRDEA